MLGFGKLVSNLARQIPTNTTLGFVFGFETRVILVLISIT